MVKLAVASLALLGGCDFVLRLDEIHVGPPVGIVYVQGTYNAPPGPLTAVQATFAEEQRPGDLNCIVVSWFTAGSVASVSDTAGNTYMLAGMTSKEAIYYAPNIRGSSAMTNQVTVSFDASIEYPDLRMLEYAGLATSSPLDGWSGLEGNGTDLESGVITTKHPYDLLVAGNMVEHSTTDVSPGFMIRLTTNDSQIAEDEIVLGTGVYNATIHQDTVGEWIMHMAAFKGASQAPPS